MCYHHQLRNTVIQRNFTYHCLHRPHRPTLSELERKADHYSQVAKYKKAFAIAHASAIGLGTLTAAFSSAGIATAVTGIGAFASVPIGGVAAITGISSALLTGFSKKLQYKPTKHEKLYTLAITKENIVSELVSKALNDNKISDSEFNLALCEFEKFHKLKAAIRAESKNIKNINNNAQPHQPPQPSPPEPDVEQIKTQLRKELK